MKKVRTILCISSLIITGLCLCKRGFDANFIGSAIIESESFRICSETQGALRRLMAKEGDRIDSGQVVAIIDTQNIITTLKEIDAGISQIRRQIVAKRTEVKAMKVESDYLHSEHIRVSNLAQNGSLPPRESEASAAKDKASKLRITAATQSIAALQAEIERLEIKKNRMTDHLAKCYIRSPQRGIITSRYINIGEIVMPGAPLFHLSDADSVYADFYVPQPVLSELAIGQTITIRADTPSKPNKDMGSIIPARIIWINDRAEFSPKNIQTREARNELVFKVRAVTANPDGVLKCGLPVEIWKTAEGDN